MAFKVERLPDKAGVNAGRGAQCSMRPTSSGGMCHQGAMVRLEVVAVTTHRAQESKEKLS